MRAKPTITDVAKRAGASKTAVSFVFNEHSGVGDEARERILKAAAELGWQPNARARALSSSRAMALGYVLRRDPDLLSTDPFFPQFLAGIEASLAPRGYALVLQIVSDGISEEAAYRRFSTEGRVDGVLLDDLRSSDSRVALVEELGLPAILVGEYPEPGNHPMIALDDAPAVQRAVQHLISLGHRSIGHVQGPAHYEHTRLRREAWLSALAKAGLPPGPLAEGDFTATVGANATHELLDRADPPTAILYGNDLMAIAGINAAIKRGIRVPDDLSVVGFDDITLATYISPELTTVRRDVQAWGAAAATALVDMVEEKTVEIPTLPKPRFIVRSSTARHVE